MTQALFSHRKHWAARFGTAPFLPMSRAEMDALGWDACDVILVTGDAYIDHPSFGMALVGRLLEAQGFRVGIISQPDWHSAEAFRALGQPNAVSSASPPATWTRWSTATRRTARSAPTTPTRPTPSRTSAPTARVIVYAQRCREAYPGRPVIIGGIEAACAASRTTTTGRTRCAARCCWTRRRTCWSSATPSARCSRSRIACAKGEKIGDIRDVRGTGFMVAHDWLPPSPQPSPSKGEGANAEPKPISNWIEVLSTELDTPGAIEAHVDPYADVPLPRSRRDGPGERARPPWTLQRSHRPLPLPRPLSRKRERGVRGRFDSSRDLTASRRSRTCVRAP